MNLEKLTLIDVLTGIFAAGLVIALWWALVLLWYMRHTSKRHKLEERLGISGEDGAGQRRELRLWRQGRQTTTLVPGEAEGTGWVERLSQLPRRAGWNTTIQSVLLGVGVAVVMVFMVALSITGNLLSAICLAALVVLVFWIYAQRAVTNYASRFEKQLVEALQLAARSLRAGHPLIGAFRLISQEMQPPVSLVFGEVCQRQSMGDSLEQAILRVTAGSDNQDLKLVAASIVIQLRSGGNLADMMDRLARVVHERMRLNRRVRVLTAQTQLNKRILLALPLVVFLLLNLINPDYMKPLYATQLGELMVVSALISMALGAWTMNRMAHLKY